MGGEKEGHTFSKGYEFDSERNSATGVRTHNDIAAQYIYRYATETPSCVKLSSW